MAACRIAKSTRLLVMAEFSSFALQKLPSEGLALMSV
jgi:hypothetical protein